MTERLSKAFFALIRAGLGLNALETEELRGLTAEDWNALHEESKSHTVLGIVFDAMQELPSSADVPLELIARWAMEVEENAKAWTLQSNVISAQNATWEKNGIKGIVLKGHTVAAMYPAPCHRCSGDVDWWFGSDEGWARANSIAERISGPLEEDSDGDKHYMFKGIMLEHHRRWNDASSRKAAKALKGKSPDSPEAVLIMLNLHILKHAMVFGVGLRQVCDIVMAYRHYDGGYDEGEMKTLIEKCGLKKWTGLLMGLIRRVFGEDVLPSGALFGGNVPDRDVDVLLSFILSDGNFGKDKGRDAGSLLSTILSRAWLFMKYAPAEYVARLSGLFIGRLKRKNR